MVRYLVRRTTNSLFILLGISLLAYLLIYMAPADPAQVIAAQRIGGPAQLRDIEALRAEYGLDQPILAQYLVWLWQTAQGDLGYSIRTGNLVSEEIRQSLRYSALLGSATMFFVLLLSIPAGILAAVRRHSVWDQIVRLLSLVSVSVPEFWLAFLLILVFAIYLGWLPSFGARTGMHLVLPMVALGLGHAARLSRLIRSILIEQLHQDYIRTAKGKGLTRAGILVRHVLPNTAVPLVTVMAYQFSTLVSGSIIIETVFSWPGLGNYYIVAVNYRDIPVIQATVLVFATIIIGMNLLADVSYALFDPRIRLQ